MYILVIVHDTPTLDGNIVRRYASRSQRALFAHADRLIADCRAWRLHDGSGWCDGTENAWRWIVNPYGPGDIVEPIA